MNPKFVKDWMTCDPVSITRDTSLPEASRLMTDNGIRHLSVVEHGKVVGIVTWGDIREASASDATSLTVFELAYLLKNKIGGLPVVEDEKLVGILTESDIFQMLITPNAA